MVVTLFLVVLWFDGVIMTASIINVNTAGSIFLKILL